MAATQRSRSDKKSTTAPNLRLVETSPEASRPTYIFDRPNTLVVMNSHGQKHVVECTPENEQLFFFNQKTERLELSYYSSAIVVDTLLLHLESQNLLPTDHRSIQNPRKFAFFDIDGNFYNQAHLEDLEMSTKTNGHTVTKHTAYFNICNDYSEPQAIQIPIDEIHCIGYANAPLTWDGDNT